MMQADAERFARPYTVALTGGIAAGKSLVARGFEARGVHVYDADVATRELVAPGAPALAEIRTALGPKSLHPDGSLDRKALREQVFSDPIARRKLEAILHPRVRTWLVQKVAADRGPYCLLAIPLLAENRADYAWVDRVLVVDTPEALQIKRLMQRDGATHAGALQALAAQATRAERLAIADDVLPNASDPATLEGRIETLHQRYLDLARVKAGV